MFRSKYFNFKTDGIEKFLSFLYLVVFGKAFRTAWSPSFYLALQKRYHLRELIKYHVIFLKNPLLALYLLLTSLQPSQLWKYLLSRHCNHKKFMPCCKFISVFNHSLYCDLPLTRSHLRWLVITPQPARLDIFTASMLSVTEPIWLTFSRRALQEFSLIAFCTRYRDGKKIPGLVLFSQNAWWMKYIFIS